MPPEAKIGALLALGDRRTVGAVSEVVQAVLEKIELTAKLVGCIFETDAGVCMRAADALEKVSRVQPEQLQPYAGILLGLFEEAEQQEVLWHLAVLLPRLRLGAEERHRTLRVLQRCMEAKSSLVKTFALQGLTDLAGQDTALVPLAVDLLRTTERTGTPAMKARSRKLLLALRGAGESAD